MCLWIKAETYLKICYFLNISVYIEDWASTVHVPEKGAGYKLVWNWYESKEQWQISCKLFKHKTLQRFCITKKCEESLERVQRSALKIILGDKYLSYDNALKVLGLQSLKERRKELCLKFAKKCLIVPKLQRMFPRTHHKHDMGKRRSEYYQVKRGLTERLRRSAIPYMQRLLNENMRETRDVKKMISNYKPVNNGFVCKSVSLRE